MKDAIEVSIIFHEGQRMFAVPKQPAPVQEPVAQEPLTDGYVQLVPDKCDRIVWRTRYFHLPIANTPPAPQPAVQEPVAHTYASTQATMCACCGEHKHTPLRIDKMGGYVCLTCIDKKLESLLGEFGHPPTQPAVPLTDEQISAIGSKIFPSTWNPRHAEFARAILAAAPKEGQP
jgi:hypothetical protein